MLSPTDYQEFSWQYINQIIEALKDHTPVIALGKGCWFALHEMGNLEPLPWVSIGLARQEMLVTYLEDGLPYKVILIRLIAFTQ